MDPGATLNTFGTGWDNFDAETFYCAPGTSGVPPTQVGVIVTFADSRGVPGSVEATTFVE